MPTRKLTSMSRKTKKNFRKQQGGANQTAMAAADSLVSDLDNHLNDKEYRNAVQTIVASALCLKAFTLEDTEHGTKKYNVEEVKKFLKSCEYEDQFSHNLATILRKIGISKLAQKFGFPYKEKIQSDLLTDAHKYLITSKALNTYFNKLLIKDRSGFINLINIKLASNKLPLNETFFKSIIDEYKPNYEDFYPESAAEPIYNIASSRNVSN